MYVTNFKWLPRVKEQITLDSRKIIRFYKGAISLEYILKMDLFDFFKERDYVNQIIEEENKSYGK